MGGITRRNFINGTLVATGASMFSIGSSADSVMSKLTPDYYPPARTGLRGSHPGSNEHAHSRAWTQHSDWGASTDLKETYDLVVVGGGLSGLAAAYFYQKKHGVDKKILILDNHDDFGGHAKRNEHTIDGKTLIGYGGSQSIVNAQHASKLMVDMFDDIGVDIKRFETAYDRSFYKRNKLGAVTYFDKENFGEDKVVKHPYCNHPNYLEGLSMGELSHEEAAQQAPLSPEGKQQLLRVLKGAGEGDGAYFDYLRDTLGVTDPKIMLMARNSTLDWGSAGADTLSVDEARAAGGMGFPPVEVYDKNNPYIYHYPDGNAGVARALVKKMIPEVGPGKNAEELVVSKFEYATLDRSQNSVRIRLNSTVVKVQHLGDPGDAGEVSVSYINDNKSYQVKGKGVVMACYNMMIPHIVADLPEDQDAALRQHVKSPLQYTNVGLKNWKAIKEIGMGFAMSPGKMHQAVLMDFPVSLGGYRYTQTPDEPCIIQMIHCPYGAIGAPAQAQFKEARYKMLTLQFSDYENEIRGHLSGMFPTDLFDFDRDVSSISVNRWAHGYAGRSPAVGRRPFGRITIANSDAAGSADAQAAMQEGHRAVSELG
ncbi:MAG: NAD(P)-binding protein [Chloroflexota bacterium]